MAVHLFDSSLYVPRVLVKRLQLIAEELSHYGGKEVDEHDVARQILEEFCRVRLHEASRIIARKMSGRDIDEEVPGRYVNLDIAPPQRTFMFHDWQQGVHERLPLERPRRRRVYDEYDEEEYDERR